MSDSIYHQKTDTLIGGVLKFNNSNQKFREKASNIRLLDKIADQLVKRKTAKDITKEQYIYLLTELKKVGLRDRNILHFYIRFYLGYFIPRVSYCKQHCAPFDFIVDMFFERVVNAIVFANRTGGKTICLAILNHLDMNFKDNCEVCNAGSTRDQSGRAHRYLKDFHYTNDGLLGSELLASDPTKLKVYYKNNSFTEIITASEKGLNGPHPQKARIDEIELIDSWEIFQQGLSMAKSSPGVLGQNIFSSTRKYGTGIMQRLLDYADDYNKSYSTKKGPKMWKIYKWCIWETVQRCDRKCKNDPEYGNCPAYEKCRGKAHGVKDEGWYLLLDLIAKTATMDTDTWNTEWLNKKPSGSVFVYGDYWNKDVHIIPRREIGGDLYQVGAIDFGTSPGHDFVFQGYILDVAAFRKEVEEAEAGDIIKSKIKFYLDYEYRSSGKKTLDEHVEHIKQWRYYGSDRLIFRDPSAAQEGIELEVKGINTEPAINAVESGISLVKGQLMIADGQANFYIFDDYFNCEDIGLLSTDLEFERYRYKKTKDGFVNPKEPMKVFDHGMDCVRYVVQSSIPYFLDIFTVYWEEIEEDGFFFSRSNNE